MVDLDTLSAEIQSGLIADQGIMDTFGLEMLTVDQGVCEINCDVPGALINAKGFAHGSIAFAVMDTACAYALRSVGVSGVTIHGDTHFVRGAGAGDRLFARVEIISRSRRVATLRGETFLIGSDGDRQLSAHGSFVFQLRS